MSTAGLFVLMALTIGVLTFIIWPLIARTATADIVESNSPDAAVDTLAQFQRDYDATLITLRDLDFDFQTGKLAAADYPPQREALLVRGADLLRTIEVLKTQSIDSAVESVVAEERAARLQRAPQPYRKRIEAALAAKAKTGR